jgi:hypothetical protein
MKSRFLLVAGVLTAVFFTVAAAYRNNYGMAAPQDSPLQGGRVGAAPPTGPVTLSGILVDAGCLDRSQANLTSPPIQRNVETPAETPQEEAYGTSSRSQTGFASRDLELESPPITAWGITIDKQTLAQEQADVLDHQVPDLFTRQPDDSCAITGDTKAFALLTDKGRLLNLDEGGNTWAWQAVQSSNAGRAVLNGSGSGFKPHAVVKGEIWADQLIVQSLSL